MRKAGGTTFGHVGWNAHFLFELIDFQALDHHVHIALLQFAFQSMQVCLQSCQEHRIVFAVLQVPRIEVLWSGNDEAGSFEPK